MSTRIENRSSRPGQHQRHLSYQTTFMTWRNSSRISSYSCHMLPLGSVFAILPPSLF
jgi:hypothetical protein